MLSRNPHETSRRRSIDAARSSLRLAAFLGVIGVAVLVAGWPGARIALGLSAFFLLIGLLESLNPRLRSRATAESAATAMPLPVPGTFGTILLRGEPAFGTTLAFSDRVVLLDLAEDERLEERKRFALELVARARDLEASFAAFKQAEASRNRRYADVILGLQIEWISLQEPDPRSGEVYFTRESGEDLWFCGLQELTFLDLLMES
jgi:hypothetical protein